MRLFRFGMPGEEKPGAVDPAGNHRDVSSLVADYDERFFETGGLVALETAVSTRFLSLPAVDEKLVRFGSPVARPSKLIGVGLNYRDHAKEMGVELPREPKIFMKATSAICGVTDRLLLPRGSKQTDYEIELAVVIGQTASYVTREDAMNHVAGYTICNDYSERDFQKNRSGQFVKGKSADSFAPLGPYLVTHGDFSDARLWCSVNGEMRQDSTTAQMVFSVAELIESLSQYMTLLPGDVITTGTPSGVALGMNPPRFIEPNDRIEFGIDGIGEGKQIAREYLPEMQV